MDAVFSFIRAAWPYFIVLAPGAYALYRQWTAEQKAGRKERTDLVKIAQDAAAEVIQELRDEASRLRTRVAEIEAELAAVRKENSEMILAKDARIAILEGELRQKEALIHSYEDLLHRHGIEAPAQGQVYWEVAQGGAPGALTPVQRVAPR